MNYLSKLLCINKSFDLITRVIELKGHKAAIYCIDGFVKSDTLEKLLEFMFKKTDSFKQPEDFPTDASSFLTLLLPYCEIKLEANFAHGFIFVRFRYASCRVAAAVYYKKLIIDIYNKKAHSL